MLVFRCWATAIMLIGLAGEMLPVVAQEVKDACKDLSTDDTKVISFSNIRIIGSTVFTESRGISKINFLDKLIGEDKSKENKEPSQKDFETLIAALKNSLNSSGNRVDQSLQVSQDDADKIVKAVNLLYQREGYISSLAKLDRVGDAFVICVIEGRLDENIKIEGLQRLRRSYVADRLAKGIGVPLNAFQLEEQLKLLKADPLLSNLEASIRPFERSGKSNLTVKVIEAPAFSSSVSLNNYSPPSVGAERAMIELDYRNLTGIGDRVSVGYSRTLTGGSESFDLGYQVPINSMNGTLQFRLAPSRTAITQKPFNELGLRGKQQVYEINYRQPIVRSLGREFALSLGLTRQTGQSFLFERLPNPFGIGADEEGKTKTSVIRFGQDYTIRDIAGIWSLRSQFSFGTGLFGVTRNSGDIPDGLFFTWLGQVQRLQKLGRDHLLLMQADIQLTPDPLLPSQQFVIGGGQSVRGYRQNARSGDNGVRFVVEDRIALQRSASGEPTLQLVPFVDLGATWNQPSNPNPQLEQRFLIGGGLGMIWNGAFGMRDLHLRLDYGQPFVTLDDKGKGWQDQGLYFSLQYQPR
jgi:hemolysin activation/secretion protein